MRRWYPHLGDEGRSSVHTDSTDVGLDEVDEGVEGHGAPDAAIDTCELVLGEENGVFG